VCFLLPMLFPQLLAFSEICLRLLSFLSLSWGYSMFVLFSYPNTEMTGHTYPILPRRRTHLPWPSQLSLEVCFVLKQGLTMPRLVLNLVGSPAGLGLKILLPQYPECWNYRCAGPCLAHWRFLTIPGMIGATCP
jgi:hypothetical protein